MTYTETALASDIILLVIAFGVLVVWLALHGDDDDN
jgi:hypothetical protein